MSPRAARTLLQCQHPLRDSNSPLHPGLYKLGLSFGNIGAVNHEGAVRVGHLPTAEIALGQAATLQRRASFPAVCQLLVEDLYAHALVSATVGDCLLIAREAVACTESNVPHGTGLGWGLVRGFHPSHKIPGSHMWSQ